jgi:SagB-type dehydrogenase family enzyme
MATPRSTAEEYHRLTKYSPETLLSGPGLDWSKQPDHFKEIVSSQRTPLRGYLPVTWGQSAPEPPAGAKDFDPDGIGLGQISRLLFFTNGVTAAIRFQGGRSHYLRAAPSAGALYPTEIYLALRTIDGIEDGLYNYQASNHELVRLWDGDRFKELKYACGGSPVLDEVRACFVFTGLLWRSAWRYQERGYRRVLLDSGHVVANLTTYASHEQVVASPLEGFRDRDLNGIFYFDENVESALAVVPILPPGTPLDWEPGWSSPPREGAWLETTTFKDEADLRGSATIALHQASACSEPAPVPGPGAPASSELGIPLVPPGDLDESMPKTILKRRSARGYQPRSIPFDALGRACGYALCRDDDATWLPPTRSGGLLDLHLVAFEVDGLEAGLYRVEGRGESLLPLSVGNLRERVHQLTLGQEITRNCAAILVFTAPAARAVETYGDRAYRYLHLDAGAIGQRFQLGVAAQELAACGVGGFFDDEAAALVERSTDDFVLYLVTVGVGN